MTITAQLADLSPDDGPEPPLSLAAQVIGLADDPQDAPDPPPSSGDPVTVAMYTAHRVDDCGRHLAHASERLDAARKAGGDLRDGHMAHVAHQLDDAHTSAHQLAGNLRAHYPAEGAELDALMGVVGLAVSVSKDAKTATTAHLVQTTCNHLAHTIRHVTAMGEDPAEAVWDFNAEHARTHLDGALEHVGKLTRHLEDNYPAEAGFLAGLGTAVRDAKPEGGPETISEQANADGRPKDGTISSQALEFIGDGHGHHIPGTPMVYRHGWVPISGQAAHPALASQGRFGTVDSLHAHTRPDGALTPERQALHDRIVAGALAGHLPQQHPVATFMGGGPASGKSHLPGTGTGDSVHIDPDQVKEQLPEYGEMQARGEGPAAAAYTHEESSLIAKRIEAEAVARHLNLTLDGVGDSTFGNMAGRVAAAKKAGYQVAGRYVTIDTAEALARNRTRQAETARWVPEVVIRDKHAKVSRVFPQLVSHGLLDSAELWDNNVPKGAPPVLIGSKAPGGRFQVHDQAAYQRFTDKANDAPA
jgi:predicted ABC-type ATPase